MIEKLTQTANGVVDALKGSPALLVIVLLNCIMLAAVFYQQHQSANRVGALMSIIVERCLQK